MSFNLREYQAKALEDVKKFLFDSKKHSAIVVQPTGAGKSILAAEIAMLIKEPVLIIQPSKELLMQNYTKYTSYGFMASIFSASLNRKEVGHVTFATPQSIKNNTKHFKDIGVKLIVVDECHLGSGTENTIFGIKNAIGATKVIGLTATPVIMQPGMFGSELKMMNRSRKSFFQDIIHVTQIQELTSKKFWTKIDYKVWSIDTKMLVSKGSEGYTEESIKIYYEKNGLNERINKGVNWLFERGCHSILIFVPLVDEAKNLSTVIPGSIAVYGDMPKDEREYAINAFIKGEVKVLINVNVLGTGFDYPKLSAIIHARPTQSVNLWYQHVGRLVRIHPDKPIATLLDFSGNTVNFGKVEDFVFEKRSYGWGMFSGDNELTSHSKKWSQALGKSVIPERISETESSAVKVSDYIIPFGKWRDKKIVDVLKEDKKYLKWIASDDFKPETENSKKFKSEAIKVLSA